MEIILSADQKTSMFHGWFLAATDTAADFLLYAPLGEVGLDFPHARRKKGFPKRIVIGVKLSLMDVVLKADGKH